MCIITPETLMVGHGSDRGGLEVVHILTANLKQNARTLCGSEQAPKESVPFVTYSLMNHPGRFFRILPATAEENSRAWQERNEIIEKTPWLHPEIADLIVIRPTYKSINGYQMGLEQALRQLCGIQPPRVPSKEGALSPMKKRELRINQARAARAEEFRRNMRGW